MLFNVNKLKPYKYMESKVQKQESQMPIYWEQSGGGLQEKDFDMEVGNEYYVSQKPQMWGNEKKKWMEDPKVKIILTSKLQMTNKMLNDNYKSKELLFHNEMNHEVHNGESMTQKFEVAILVVSIDLTNVLAQSVDVSTQLVEEV